MRRPGAGGAPTASFLYDCAGFLQRKTAAAKRGKLAGIGAQWRGAGSTAFQQVMTRWDEDARKITSALNEFEANLRSSEQVYNANDESQSSTFSKLAGRLG